MASADTFLSITRCYKLLACCKVSIQLQRPLHDFASDRVSVVFAERGVCCDQAASEQVIGVSAVKTLGGPHVMPKTTRATAHQSKVGPPYLSSHERKQGG